jgi:hypothetical protein
LSTSSSTPCWRLAFHLGCTNEHRWDAVVTLPADAGKTRLRLTMCCPMCGRTARWLGRVVNAEPQSMQRDRAGRP